MGKKIRGFTIIEVMLVLVVLIAFTIFFLMFDVQKQYREMGKELADQTKMYANLFAPYLNDMSESNLYVMSGSNTCVRIDPFIANNTDTAIIKIEDLQATTFGKRYIEDIETPPYGVPKCRPLTNNYWNEILTGTNRFKQKPCLGVTKDTGGNYHGFLYWVNVPGSRTAFPQVVKFASIALGGAGAYTKNGQVIGGGGWSVALSDPRFNAAACGGTLDDKTLVMNFDQYMPTNSNLNGRLFLSRESDIIHDQGTSKNLNTAQADIVMNGNKLVLDKENNISLQSQGNNATVTGTLAADSLTVIEAVDTGTTCAPNEVSMIKRQKDQAAQQLGIQVATEICSNAPVICRLYGNSDYCYLPTKKGTVRFTDFNHVGKLGTSFKCPQAIPYMKGATAWQANANPTVNEIKMAFNGYNIVYGATAVSDAGASCATWQFDARVYRPSTRGVPQWQNATLSCSQGTTYKDNGFFAKNGWSLLCDGKSTDDMSQAHNWRCTKSSPPPPVMLETVICTNKYFIDTN